MCYRISFPEAQVLVWGVEVTKLQIEGIQILADRYIILFLRDILLLFSWFRLPFHIFQFCSLPWLQRKHL